MPRYSMIILWSDEDEVFVVTLPEFGCKTHGDTYEDAAKEGRVALESLIEAYQTEGDPLPPPAKYQEPS